MPILGFFLLEQAVQMGKRCEKHLLGFTDNHFSAS